MNKKALGCVESELEMLLEVLRAAGVSVLSDFYFHITWLHSEPAFQLFSNQG